MKEALRIEDERGVTVFQLRSVMVEWKDVGIDPHSAYVRSPAFTHKLDEVEQWLANHCGRHDISRRGIWFLDPDDAMMFKLTWGGMMS